MAGFHSGNTFVANGHTITIPPGSQCIYNAADHNYMIYHLDGRIEKHNASGSIATVNPNGVPTNASWTGTQATNSYPTYGGLGNPPAGLGNIGNSISNGGANGNPTLQQLQNWQSQWNTLNTINQVPLTYTQIVGGPGASSGHTVTSTPIHTPNPRLKLDREVTVGEKIGYRAWYYRKTRAGHDRLASISMSSVWEPNRPMIGRGIGDATSEGVYCYKTNSDLLTHLGHMSCAVYGTIWLWGVVIEYDYGYRAEFARVRSIDYSPDGTISERMLQTLRQTYNVVPFAKAA